MLNLENIRNIHIIGIGGIGISALAQFLLTRGKHLTANDLEEFPMIPLLRKKGVHIEIGTGPEVIPEGVELVVYSGAWTTLGPELLEYAKTLGVPVLSYPEMLSIVSKKMRTIAISGAHGKTTTTAMVAHLLIDAQFDPTVIVGSVMKDFGSNFRAGKSDYLVIEADEYRRAFLNLTPEILVIVNIDLDHLDYYKDIEDIKNAYRELIARMPENGLIIYDNENQHMRDVLLYARCRTTSFRSLLKRRSLMQGGAHYQLDAAAACTVADVLGISRENYERSIETFAGTARRSEERGRLASGTLVIDDYAHHPTEVRATLSALREKFPPRISRIVVLFHPHLYSRTRTLWGDFVAAFDAADSVCLLPIYAAREVPESNITSERLATEMGNHRGDIVTACASFDDAVKTIAKMNLGPNDVFVTMGAGEAYKVGDELLK